MTEPPPAPSLSCPTCGETTKQHRAGKNLTGSLRRECRQALKLYVDGTNLRRIARHLDVNPQTVANWVNAAKLPAPPLPKERQSEPAVETLELDELFTFVS